MSLISKNVFYSTVGQNKNDIQLTVRSKDWEAQYLLKACSRIQKNTYDLLNQKYVDLDELLIICRSMMIDIIGVSDFLRHLDVVYPESLDDYNSMYLNNKTFEELFKQVRNGLIHTTIGDGLLHKTGKISKSLAVPYYVFQGEDALFAYKYKINDYKPKDDVCFGCGYYRISLLNHLIPYLKFSWQELKTYNQPFQGNEKKMKLNLAVLEKPQI